MKSWFFIREICSGFAWPLHNISLFILSFEQASSLGGLMREETVTQMQTAEMNGASRSSEGKSYIEVIKQEENLHEASKQS